MSHHKIKSIFGIENHFRIEFIQTKRARQNCNNSLEIDYLHTVVNSDIIPPSKVKSNTYK